MSDKTKKPGRPEGSKNREYAVAVTVPSSCPECGSTERTEYINKSELEHEGIDPFGRPFNLIVWRTCQCKECGQWRRDKSYESA